MKTALIAEYRKFFSTRMWWLLLIVMVGYLGFMGLVMAFSFTSTPEGNNGENPLASFAPKDVAQMLYSLPNMLGYVFPLVVGSLAVTSEFRHKTITSSLLAEPRRGVLLGAKLLSGVPMGLLYGVAAVVAVLLSIAPMLAFVGDGAFLTDGSTITLLFMVIVVMMLWTIMGIAFGSVVTNQVAAIVILLALTQLVEPIARVAFTAIEPLQPVSQFLPGAAADAVIGSSFLSAMGGDGAAELLSRPAGIAVMLAYIAVFALIGRYFTFRRDI